MSNCEVCQSALLPGAFFCGECGSSTRPRLDSGIAQRTDTRAVPMSEDMAVRPRPTSSHEINEGSSAVPVLDPVNPAGGQAQPREPHFAEPMRAPTSHESGVDDATVLRSPPHSFTLRFSNGDSVSVTSGGLLGRNPVAGPGEQHEHLVIVTDHDRTVSKTHLEFGIDAGDFWVCDRFSGNGTTVQEPGHPMRRLVPGRRYRIVPGTTVGIGEQSFTLT